MELVKSILAVQQFGLKAPSPFRDLSVHDIIAQLPSGGGCGPGQAGDKYIPDIIWGLNIKPCCTVHDWEYQEAEKAKTEEERMKLKRHADANFLYNMVLMISQAGGYRKYLRFLTALGYFIAVHGLGGSFIKEEG